MISTVESQAFDRAVTPVLKQVLPEAKDMEVFEFSIDAELRSRIDELASKSTEGELTEAEQFEYQGYVRANKFLAIFLRQVRRIGNSGD